MCKTMAETYKSRVYTDRPAYADFNSAAKFVAIQSIIGKHLTQHPKAICSYSGGADSDINSGPDGTASSTNPGPGGTDNCTNSGYSSASKVCS